MNLMDQKMRNPHEEPNIAAGVILCAGHSLATAAFLLSACLTGCAAPEQKARPLIEAEQARLAEESLADSIKEFADFFTRTVEKASTEIERRSSQREHRREAALWRLHLIEECRSHAAQEDPWEAIVDLWTLGQRQLDYFSTGQGKTLFGEYQTIAMTAVQQIDAAVQQIARNYIPEDDFKQAKARVVAYAQQHPIDVHFGGQPPQRLSDDAQIQSKISEIASLPLAPLTALRGVGKTPDSVRDASRSMDRFTAVVEDLPSSARWQAQLLAMNLEELPTVSNASASFKQLADSSAEFVQVLDGMPVKVREQAEVLLDRVDESHPEMRSTLGDAQKTIELVRVTNQDVKETVIQAEKTAAGVGEAAAALEDLANAITITVQEIQKLTPKKDRAGKDQVARPDHSTGADGRNNEIVTAAQEISSSSAGGDTPPTLTAVNSEVAFKRSVEERRAAGKDTSFSFQAVTESANALGETSLKLQALLVDLRAFIDAKSLSQESVAVSAALGGVVDHVAKRTAQLLLLLFSLLVVYALVRMRLRRSKMQSPGT